MLTTATAAAATVHAAAATAHTELDGVAVFATAAAFTMHHTLDDLILKYQDNEYVRGRLKNYITHLLPIALENADSVHKQREERKQNLQLLQEDFILRFLSTTNCFYHTYAERFFHYNGLHFQNYNEDNLHHAILSSISTERSLMDWKYKSKTTLLKLVKERALFKAVPEPATIQFVIKTLFPEVFPTRNHVKYFLTVVGDCLFGGNDAGLVYFIPPHTKDIIQAFDAQSYMYALPSLMNDIKFKFHQHTYANCRLLTVSPPSQDSSSSSSSSSSHSAKRWEVPLDLSRHLLDFLVVAAHYTTRYGSADNYLKTCSDQTLVQDALYLKENTPESVVQSFINVSLFPSPNSNLDYKNMLFLWKLFLKERKLPGIVFHDTLKTLLLAKGIAYDTATETYLNVSGINMPAVSSFVHFWNTTMEENDSDELEMAELLALVNASNKKIPPLSEQYLFDLIRHFYPEVVIEDNTFILQRKCRLWNKRDEVKLALEQFISATTRTGKTLNDAYVFYLGSYAKLYLGNEEGRDIHCGPTSKRYFEKVAQDMLHGTIDDDGLLCLL